MTELRPYQRDVIADIEREIAAGKRRIIAVAPTGAGKTVVAASIINDAVAKGQRVLVLAHTREIIQQTSAETVRLRHRARHHPGRTCCRSGLGRCRSHRLQRCGHAPCGEASCRCRRPICSSSTSATIARPTPTARSSTTIRNAMLIGLTATPCRGDGRGLGGIFDVIVECPQVAELIEQKYLVRTRVFAPVNPGPERRRDPRRRLCRDPTRRSDGPCRTWSATSSAIGTSTANAGKRSASPSTSHTRCISATNS